jgi:hypothetical protein
MKVIMRSCEPFAHDDIDLVWLGIDDIKPTKRLRRFHLGEEEEETGKQYPAGLEEKGSRKFQQGKPKNDFNGEPHRQSSLRPQKAENPETSSFRGKTPENQNSDENSDDSDGESDDLDGFVVSDCKNTTKNSLKSKFEWSEVPF